MKKGFTLAEILIVIGIICLLMVAISPFLRGNQDQAMLSRQTDIVRQGFYETVMRAKTGATENTATELPLRGFLISKASQEIRAVVWDTLSLETAKTQNIPSLLGSARQSINLLKNDAGHEGDKPLAEIKELQSQPGNQSITQALILLESVSNDVLVLTDQGILTNPTLSMTLTHPLSPIMTRSLNIDPTTGIINLHD